MSPLATSLSYVNPNAADQEGYRSILISRAGRPPAVPPERYRIGEKIGGRYEVLAIHRGGMGVVYATYDHRDRLPRALKTLQWRFAGNPNMRKLFAEEAAVWVELEKHPFIVQATLVQDYDGQPFVITEYIRGPQGMGSDLQSWLGHPRLTLPVAVEMGLQIAQGMQHATRKIRGLLHRDLKPANILVDDRGRALVTDFGLVRAAEAGAGTPAYMAPEQWRSGRLDQRTDIYSYGCILYEMFTGHRLFAGRSIEEWEAAHLGQMPIAISLLADVPADIEEFVFRCLSKNPDARPPGWDEIVETFAEWYQRLTGHPAVRDFSRYELTLDDLIGAGHSMGQLGRYREMLEISERVLAKSPNYREALINKVAALDELGRWDEALKTVDHVLSLNAKDAFAWNNKGVVLGRLGRNEESLAAAVQSLEIDPKNSLAWRNKAIALGRLGRVEEQLTAYDQAVAIDPRHGMAWYGKACALQNLERWEEALAAAEGAIAINPIDTLSLRARGVSLEKLGRLDEALAVFDRALAVSGDAVEGSLRQSASCAWHRKGTALLDAGQAQQALAAYDRALAIDSRSAWHLNGRALALEELGRYQEMLEAADRAVKIADEYEFYALRIKGTALRKLGRYEDALVEYDRAIAIDPKHSGVWTSKAVALESLKRWEEALAAADRILALDPQDRFGWEHRAVALGGLKRWEEKLAAALAIDPKHPIGSLHQGIALHRLGRIEESLAAYDRMLAARPDHAETWCYKAEALESRERWAEALQAYDRALNVKPKDKPTWMKRAAAAERLGRFDEVLAACEQVLGIDPKDFMAWLQKAGALLKLGRGDEMAAAYDQAASLCPDEAIFDNKGVALASLGRVDEALAAFDRALALRPDYPAALVHKAEVLEKLQRFEEALAICERALDFQPGNELARKNRDALKQRLYRNRLTSLADGHRKAAGQEGYQSILVSRASRSPAPPERYKAGEKIGGRFEVLAIHRGGMGVVYATYDHEERLPRALKALQWRFAANPNMRKLFAEEAAVWVGLEKHPFIVQALLVQFYDGQPFVITEYIRGPQGMGNDLQSWLGHPRLTLPVTVEMGLQIAQGMQHATRKIRGLLHRDLKPGNILVDDRGRALVTDFGLVRAAEAGAGTPAYMAPEQWRSGRLDQRTDIYSYGCILYQMLTGHPMFAGRSIDDWRDAHLGQMPVPISLFAKVPPEIEEFVIRCLSKNPDARPGCWDEIVETLAQWFHRLTGQPVVLEFGAYELSASELVGASHSMGELDRHAEMLEICERLLAQSPNYREGMINKIAALHKLGRYHEALATIEQVLAANPRDVLALDSKSVVLGAMGRNEESLASIEQALAIDPGKQHAWRAKGWALERLGRVEEEVAAYEQALARDARDVDTWISKMQALGKLRRWDEVVIAADRASAVNPVDVRPWIEKAAAYAELKRPEQELAACQRVLALDPKNMHAWMANLRLHERSKRWSDALAAADSAIAVDPKDFCFWEHKVYVQYQMNRWTELLASADKALSLKPGAASASYLHRYKGNALSDLGRIEESLSAYARALELKPADSAIALLKADALKTLERVEEASAAYDHAVALDPKNCNAALCRADFLLESGRSQEALAGFESALALNPGEVKTWIGKIRALTEMERWDEVVTVAEGASAAHPVDERPWIFRGRALARLGRPVAALDAFERALAVTPKSTYAWLGKLRALAGLQRWDEALAAGDRAIELNPEERKAWEDKLWVLVETRERWAEAVSVAEKALTLFPREVCGRLYYYHGMALSRLGRAGEAVAAYSNALALDAKNAAQAEPPAPPYCEVLICRAAELEKLERWAEALADYDRILELDPGAQKALRNREEVRKRMTPEKGKPGRSLSRWLSGFRQSRV